MGKFSYDHTVKVDFDDRVMAHLQIVIGAKFRRAESFYFSWIDDDSIGDGRTTVWMHPTMPVTFKYYGKKPAHINRAWVESMMLTANTPAGLVITPEPAETKADDRA